MFGGGEQQLCSDVFAMQWGVRLEMNGVASLLENFAKVSESIATKLTSEFQGKCMPISKACYLCLQVPHSCKALFLLHPLLNMQWQHLQMLCW